MPSPVGQPELTNEQSDAPLLIVSLFEDPVPLLPAPITLYLTFGGDARGTISHFHMEMVGEPSMHDRILLPTDMSPGVSNAIDQAIDLSALYNAELHVLYVVDAEAYSSYPGDEYVHEFEGLGTALERAGRKAVDEIADRAATENVETETVIRHGVPHEEILRYIDEEDIDLTVVGSKNRSGEYRRLLGSVAERVAHMAERPIMIVKTSVEEA